MTAFKAAIIAAMKVTFMANHKAVTMPALGTVIK
jgi:hypothetical protein